MALKNAEQHEEWLEEIIEYNLSKTVPELCEHIHKVTGQRYDEEYVTHLRQQVLLAMNRADRLADEEWRWSGGL